MAPPTLQELDEETCHALLGGAVIGRLAFTQSALPRILPVHFTVRGHDVVFSSLAGSKMAAALRGAIVAFEVDDYDPVAGKGWSVSIVGPSRVVTDDAEIAALDQLDFGPWSGHPDRRYIAIRTTLIQGRRLDRRSTAPAGDHAA